MPEDVLKKILHSLACQKFKVLKKIDAGSSSGDGAKGPGSNIIKPGDSFSFNTQFTCPMIKIRIPMPSLEDSSNNKRVEEDRSVAIEAAVVRIMKVK
jgi:cullin 1